MKYLPIGISDLKDFVEGNYIYVDKTKWIYELVKPYKGFYFLSRPRRFGKTLTISTLYHLFKGEKELFKGTYIYDKWAFNTWPVIRLNLTRVNPQRECIVESLSQYLRSTARELDVELEATEYGNMFAELIEKLHRKNDKDVVILIDEYDAPFLHNLAKPELQEIREIMNQFYVQLKAQGEYIKFIFLTGISKFSKVSIFSKLNNLEDLSMYDEYATFLGYTEEEIDRYFRDHIEKAKKALNLTEERFWEKLSEWYNGYSWNGKDRVYTPFSIINFFKRKQFSNFWYESGSPSFLIRYVEKKGISELENLKFSPTQLSAREIEESTLPIFLWQAGYLTIVYRDTEAIVFDYPNREVEQSFSELLTMEYTEIEDIVDLRTELRDAFSNEDWETFVKLINKVISSYPYHVLKDLTKESHWQVIIRAALAVPFGRVHLEDVSSRGRSDLVVLYNGKVLVVELKVNRSARDAIEQIRRKGYAEKYRDAWIMGVNINTEKRRIEEWKVERT